MPASDQRVLERDIQSSAHPEVKPLELPGFDDVAVVERRKRKRRGSRGRESSAIYVKVGAVGVPIYRYPDRWAIVYREAKGAKRKTVSCQTEAKAREKAGDICRKILRGQIDADRLTPDERMQAVAARKLLLPLGLSLDAAAREIVQARQITRGAGAIETARFWAKHHTEISGPVLTVPQIHVLMLGALLDHDLAPRWRQALEMDLGKFTGAFAEWPISEITADDIQEWLRLQPGNWRTRNNRLNLVRQFFRFARRKGQIPQDRDTEADKVDRLKRPRGEHSRPGVLSAEELGVLLASVKDEWLPFVALGAFAGLRRAEIERLDWGDLRWSEKEIHVRQEVAKSTRRRAGDERFVPMRAQLLAWLKPWRGKASGPVCKRKQDDPDAPAAFEDEKQRLRAAGRLHGKWPKNALRHTYGSCRMGETKNMPKVADEMGNSVAEVRRDYRNPRPAKEVKAWAALRPVEEKLPENVVPMNAAV